MRKENFSHLECSLARSLDMIGEWWTLLIIRDLFYGIDTFDQLCKDLSISRNILTDRLKKLVDRSLVEKFVKQEGAVRQSYRLTERGKDLFPIIMALVAWGDKWEAPKGAPIIFRHGNDGHPAKPIVICEQCGLELKPRDVVPEKGEMVKNQDGLPLVLKDKAG